MGKKWCEGNFWFGNHKALLNDEKYNREVYNFWRAKVVHRIKDPKKEEIPAPENPPHPFLVSIHANFRVDSSDPVIILLDADYFGRWFPSTLCGAMRGLCVP